MEVLLASIHPSSANRFLATMLMGLALFVPALGFANSAEFNRVVLPFLEKYCYECHGGQYTKADLNLKIIRDDSTILKDQKQWRKVMEQVSTGDMPPKKKTVRPSMDEMAKFNSAVRQSMALAESKLPVDPGHVTVRRLNRTEYYNTVRDLLHVDFNPTENFPADDIGYGFDNIGDVLSLSPVHLERYLDAAENIADRAILLKMPEPPSRTTYSIFLEPSNYHSENGTRPVTNNPARLFVRHDIKVAGQYTFKVRAAVTNLAGATSCEMRLWVDDKNLLHQAVTNELKKWKTFEVNLDLSAGEHRFAAEFVNPPQGVVDRMLFINEFKLVGPADTRTEFMKSMDELAGQKPAQDKGKIWVDWFVTKAFRRPLQKSERTRFEQIYLKALNETNGSPAIGMQQIVKAALCSPKFLFRPELERRSRNKKPYPLDDFQLASRLSYFLWSSMPDEELMRLAGSRKLASNLESQVKRMLKDPKAQTLVQNFGLQWLQLQRLRTFQPDRSMFPEFTETLRDSMLGETELFLGELVHEDRSVLDLMDADFTYVDRPLARLYGLEKLAFGPEADPAAPKRTYHQQEFVRVRLPDKSRGGLLTQASVLTVTSNPTRTSPVKRGKWVLEQILGTPPPPPPSGVAELDAQKELKGTLRQRMEQHRANPTCAGCHRQMDSLGFAFENFDAVGRFRAKDSEGPIDPSGVLPDGQSFNGPGELKQILKSKKELVVHNLVEKLMTYALGRGLDYYDDRAVRKAASELESADYRFSALVTSIVKSEPFLLRRGKDADAKPTLAGAPASAEQKN